MTYQTVIEIGSHYDGTVLEREDCQGAQIWLIDAVPEFLRRIGPRPNVRRIPRAVTVDTDGPIDVWRIDTKTQQAEDLPMWSTKMNSVKPGHPTVEHFGWRHLYHPVRLGGLSVETMWRRYRLPHNPDFLALDIEGYDFEILNKILDLGISPQVIRFETKQMSDAELNSISTELYLAGFPNMQAGDEKDFRGISFNHWAWRDGHRPRDTN